jgi:hypothetical protein
VTITKLMSSARLGATCARLSSALLLVVCAHGQRFEITPLIGGMFGGTVHAEQVDAPRFEAHLGDRLSYGIAGGVRFGEDDCDNCQIIEFRWLRQATHLSLDQNPFLPDPTVVSAFNPRVTVNNFLGDFTHEFVLKDREWRKVAPFITATLGAARITAPESSATRFVFGFATGLKVFPKPHWGFRVQVEYLPIVMEANLQRLVCINGGCIVALNGSVLNQLQLSAGPAFRF